MKHIKFKYFSSRKTPQSDNEIQKLRRLRLEIRKARRQRLVIEATLGIVLLTFLLYLITL